MDTILRVPGSGFVPATSATMIVARQEYYERRVKGGGLVVAVLRNEGSEASHLCL
jgi:hypothetical protein